MADHVITVAMAFCGRYITPKPHDIINYHSLYHPLAILRREVCVQKICTIYDTYRIVCLTTIVSQPFNTEWGNSLV